MCFNQDDAISSFIGKPLNLVDQFIYLGSNISSYESDVNTHTGKGSAAINRLSTVWKSDLSDKIKQDFFQAIAVSVLLYGCTIVLLYSCTVWTQTKPFEKKLDGYYTKMMRAVLNKSWKQHFTKQQWYRSLLSISKPIQVSTSKTAVLYWRTRNEILPSRLGL